MAVGAGVAMVAGTGLSFLGQMDAAKKEEEAAKFNAETNRQQANEMLRRFEINKGLLVREVESFKAQQVAAFAKSGVDINSGSALVQLEQTQNQLSEQLKFMQIEANAKAEAMFRGADLAEFESRELRGARELSAFGGALGGLGQAGSIFAGSRTNRNIGANRGLNLAGGN